MADTDPDNLGDEEGLGEDEGYSGWNDPAFEKALSRGSQAAASLSIIGAFCVIVTFFVIRKLQPKLAQRVSLRLAVAIAVCDLLSAIFYLVAALPTGPSPICAPAMFLNVAFLLMSLFSTSAIALNIFLVFVMKVAKRQNLEKTYYIVAGIAALTIPLITWARGRFGWNESECWYKWSLDEPYEPVVIWQWTTYYGWVMLVILFCTTSTALFWWSVRRPVTQDMTTNTPQNTLGERQAANSLGIHAMLSETDRMVRRAVSRIKYYCAVPVITQTLTLAVDIEFLVREDNHPMFWLVSAIALGLHGFVNAVVFFCFDPSVERARETLRVWVVYRYYLRFFRVGKKETEGEGSIVEQKTSHKEHTITRVEEPHNVVAYHLCRLLLVREADLKRFVSGVLDKRHRESQTSKVPASANASMARGGASPMRTEQAVEAMLGSEYADQGEANSTLAAL
ncbi:hypothetical protein HDU85_005716 [Gaertneriomyces sp. JEL0708]|nr:hypothetical protein HDU85_005716 [Gaertneriomyces sp. JEL0708]